jgi:hypothetical protein
MNPVNRGHFVGEQQLQELQGFKHETAGLCFIGRSKQEEMKDDGRTPSAPIAEHLSLRPASP